MPSHVRSGEYKHKIINDVFCTSISAFFQIPLKNSNFQSTIEARLTENWKSEFQFPVKKSSFQWYVWNLVDWKLEIWFPIPISYHRNGQQANSKFFVRLSSALVLTGTGFPNSRSNFQPWNRLELEIRVPKPPKRLPKPYFCVLGQESNFLPAGGASEFHQYRWWSAVKF